MFVFPILFSFCAEINPKRAVSISLDTVNSGKKKTKQQKKTTKFYDLSLHWNFLKVNNRLSSFSSL